MVRTIVVLGILCFAWFVRVEAQANRSGIYNLELSVFPVTTEGISGGEVATEYGWRAGIGRGKLSGIGFFKREFNSSWMTNHFIGYAPRTSFPVSISSEQGRIPAGAFWQVGPRVAINSVPYVRNATRLLFDQLNAGFYTRVAGHKEQHEGVIFYETRTVHAGPFGLYSEGFYRFRSVDRGEPQFWLSIDRFPIKFSFEVELVGGRAGQVSFGLGMDLK